MYAFLKYDVGHATGRQEYSWIHKHSLKIIQYRDCLRSNIQHIKTELQVWNFKNFVCSNKLKLVLSVTIININNSILPSFPANNISLNRRKNTFKIVFLDSDTHHAWVCGSKMLWSSAGWKAFFSGSPVNPYVIGLGSICCYPLHYYHLLLLLESPLAHLKSHANKLFEARQGLFGQVISFGPCN